jgi:hypothetical protein
MLLEVIIAAGFPAAAGENTVDVWVALLGSVIVIP